MISRFVPLYSRCDSIVDKITAVATKAYGAENVVIEPMAQRDIQKITRQRLRQSSNMRRKNQNSLSDNPKLLGRPTGFSITVRRALLNAGAGFIVILTGDIMRMPENT